ncbi:hypothetical protein JW905_15550, partial [bacterium]|nr:hypothetical protein [candidate division CSSED10-310 bacterium]
AHAAQIAAAGTQAEALIRLEHHIRRAPEEIEPYLVKADIMYRLGDYQQCVETYLAAVTCENAASLLPHLYVKLREQRFLSRFTEGISMKQTGRRLRLRRAGTLHAYIKSLPAYIAGDFKGCLEQLESILLESDLPGDALLLALDCSAAVNGDATARQAANRLLRESALRHLMEPAV